MQPTGEMVKGETAESQKTTQSRIPGTDNVTKKTIEKAVSSSFRERKKEHKRGGEYLKMGKKREQ